jgi:hypothetical protein
MQPINIVTPLNETTVLPNGWQNKAEDYINTMNSNPTL